MISHLDQAVVLTDAVKQDLLAYRTDLPCSVIPHPFYDHFGARKTEEESRRKLGIDPDKKTILFFGFIRKYKGLDLLIDAFGELGPEFQLLIGGESYEDFAIYQEHISRSVNAERIHVHERYISDEEVTDFFSAADVCVLPYRSATQSGIANIAMHFDLPILATRVGGVSEMIQDGENGFIIEAPRSDAVVEAIHRFFETGGKAGMRDHIQNLKASNTWIGFAQKMLAD